MGGRWIAWLLVIALLAIGCGSDGGDSSDAPKAAGEVVEEVVEAEVRVPDVVGLDLPDALQELRQSRLRPMPREVESGGLAGQVVGQIPAAGTAVPEDDPVIVEVASGSAGQDAPEGAPDAEDRIDRDSGGDGQLDVTPPSSVELQVVDSGFSWAPWGSDGAPAVSAGAVIRNPTPHVGGRFRVVYLVRDEAGNARGTESEWVRYAPADTIFHVGYRLYLDPGSPPASLEVTVEQPPVASLPAPIMGTFSSLRYAQDDVFGEWTNPTAEMVDNWLLSCVTYAGGQVSGGGWTTTDLVPADTSTSFRLGNGLVPRMQVDDIRCSAWDDEWR